MTTKILSFHSPFFLEVFDFFEFWIARGIFPATLATTTIVVVVVVVVVGVAVVIWIALSSFLPMDMT